MFILFDHVHFGCIADKSFNEDKAYRFLGDIKDQLSNVYKGNLSFILRQSNLTANCYDKMFKPNFTKVLENYNTGISSGNLQMAFQKVDEVTEIAHQAVNGMMSNT